jgi:hypothetical protein
MKARLKPSVLAALVLICASASSHAQSLSAEDLARRAIEPRAIEAVIWGMPAVNTDLMRQVQKNADGSVDIYFGPKAPAGRESNWVPTDPARKFELMFRLYAPKKEFFDKVWKLPDAEKMN